MSRVAGICATLVGLVLGLGGAPAKALDAERDEPTVIHRVVWADSARADPGIHIRSMEVDGSDLRSAYDWPHGFTLSLSLDPAGRRAAFAPCCRKTRPLLVVAPVKGGKALEPLKKSARYDAVSGIGWSPNGKRIAFEGLSGPSDARLATIWTVRPNGKGLRKVLTRALPGPDRPAFNETLAWTPDGILYSDGKDLRSARPGRSTLVMKNVFGVRSSGDGSRLVLDRYTKDKRSVWMSDPDGTNRRKLLVQGDPGEGTLYLDVSPSYDATELLATRHRPASDDVVIWRVADGPGSATVLELPDQYTVGATWN